MTNNLKTTLTGSAFALTLLSFMGCNNDDTTATTTTTTVSIAPSTITATPMANVATTVVEAATSTKGAKINLGTDTTTKYYLPLGISAPTTDTSYFTLPTNSKLVTGTVDTAGVKIKMGGTEYTDANLIGSDLKLASNIALPTGDYEVTLPSVKLGSGTGLAVDNFVIKGIKVDADGNSNFFKQMGESEFPAVGSSVANANVNFTVDTALAGKDTTLTFVSGGTTYTKTVAVGSDGKISSKFDGSTGVLGPVSDLQLTLPSI